MSSRSFCELLNCPFMGGGSFHLKDFLCCPKKENSRLCAIPCEYLSPYGKAKAVYNLEEANRSELQILVALIKAKKQ